MEPAELDFQLEELENRLERLRALYEQYFMGFEKLEPSVARKDVDRRIYVLRHEKIRNTGKRFKLQTIIQRYNTFQQYWQRICREIENGTYRRHVLRAERTFGSQQLLTAAARRRFGGKEPVSNPPAAPEARPALETTHAQPSAPMPSAPAPAAAASAPAPAASAPAPASPAPTAAPPAAPATLAAARRAASARPRAQSFESLDLDMDFLGDWDPAAAKPPPKARPSVPPSRQSVTPPPARPSSVAPARPAAAAPVKPPPEPAAAPIPVPRAAAKPPPAPVRMPALPPPPRVSLQEIARVAPAGTPAERPANPARPAAAVVERAAAARPKPPAAVSEVKAAAPPAKPAAAAGLNEDRIKELHGRLNELKRENREAGQVSLEGLAKSLRATEEKLRQQHQGRRVDFDVVVKDGKAVVKPIIR